MCLSASAGHDNGKRDAVRQRIRRRRRPAPALFSVPVAGLRPATPERTSIGSQIELGKRFAAGMLRGARGRDEVSPVLEYSHMGTFLSFPDVLDHCCASARSCRFAADQYGLRDRIGSSRRLSGGSAVRADRPVLKSGDACGNRDAHHRSRASLTWTNAHPGDSPDSLREDRIARPRHVDPEMTCAAPGGGRPASCVSTPPLATGRRSVSSAATRSWKTLEFSATDPGHDVADMASLPHARSGVRRAGRWRMGARSGAGGFRQIAGRIRRALIHLHRTEANAPGLIEPAARRG